MLNKFKVQLFNSSSHIIIRLSLILIALLLNVHHTICENSQEEFSVNNYYINVPIHTFTALLSNVALTNKTGQLFVAGLNYLYLVQDVYPTLDEFNVFYLNELSKSRNSSLTSHQKINFISSSIQIKDKFQTNKESKEYACIYSEDNCKYVDSEEFDNENRILLSATKLNSIFFVCGTAYGGLCFLANEQDGKIKAHIYANKTFKTNYVASKKSCVMFRGVYDKKPIFYVAFEPDDRPNNYLPPLFSARVFNKNLISNNLFNLDYQFNQDGQITSINIKKTAYYENNFRFIYGFIYEKFAFILKTQLFDDSYETRLGRVCTKDSSFFSYSELLLICSFENKNYAYAVTADFGQADSFLFNKLNIKKKDFVLYIVFAFYDSKMKTINQSDTILCAFSIEKILENYLRIINSCMDGSTHLSSIMKQYSLVDISKDCVGTKLDPDYFCLGSNLNPYIQGTEYVEGLFMHKFKDDYVTSIKTTILKTNQDLIKNKNYFIAGLGTSKGKMLKLSRSGDGSSLIESPKIKINPIKDVFIQPNPVLSKKSDFIYFVGEKNLAKFPLKSCLLYSNCDQCLLATDSLGCAWCNIVDEGLGFCSTSKECSDLNFKNSSKTHLSHYECPPIMYDFHPSKGPIEGKTKIIIEGENLCSKYHIHQRPNPNLKLLITIGDINCIPLECEDKKLICQTDSSEKNYSQTLKVISKDKNHEKYDVNGIAFIKNKNFSFVETKVNNLFPTRGPMYGNTKVIFEGENLDSGQNIKITIGGIICGVIERSENFLTCNTGQLHINEGDDFTLDSFNQNSQIIFEIDSNKFRIDDPNFENLKFFYQENPVLYSIKPKAAIRSGGSNITVFGKYFSSNLVKSMINFFYAGKNHKLIQECDLINLDKNIYPNSTLTCKMPAIPEHVKIDSVNAPLITELQILMDEVALKNDADIKIFRFLYYPFPKIKKLKNSGKVYLDSEGNGKIEIKGLDFSIEYNFEIYLEETEFNNNTQVNRTKRNTISNRIIPCTNKEIHSYSKLLKCKISTLNLDQNITQSKWFVKIVFDEQHQFDAGLVQLLYQPISYSWINWIIIFLFLLIIIFVIIGMTLISKGRLKFEKQLSNFSVRYNKKNSALNGTSVLDSAYNRQSLENDYHNGKDTNTPLLGFVNGKSKFELMSNSIKEMLAKENILIPQNYLTLHEKIGKGYFGCVYKGLLKVPMQEMPLQVAVKTLKNENVESSDNINSFLEEALRMKEFKHENVLTLLGVSLQENSLPFIVLPFMANGDLASYIRCETNNPFVRHLLFYAIDVANGMSYLSSIKFVHRDLAARNCMMDGNFRIKVADFGLSRDIYERNYYSSKRRAEIPIKWMAPECIEKGIATIESDVWSYGVLLWELMTRGNNPYSLLENFQVIDFLKIGGRLQRPETCPVEIYELMLDCWQMFPRLRPTFDEIIARIKEIIIKKDRFAAHEMNSYAELTVNYLKYSVEDYYKTTSIYNKNTLEKCQSTNISNNLSASNDTFTSNLNSSSTYINEINPPKLQIYRDLEFPGSQTNLTINTYTNVINDKDLKKPILNEKTNFNNSDLNLQKESKNLKNNNILMRTYENEPVHYETLVKSSSGPINETS